MFRIKIEPVFKSEQARDEVCLTSPTNFEIDQQSWTLLRNSENEINFIIKCYYSGGTVRDAEQPLQASMSLFLHLNVVSIHKPI